MLRLLRNLMMLPRNRFPRRCRTGIQRRRRLRQQRLRSNLRHLLLRISELRHGLLRNHRNAFSLSLMANSNVIELTSANFEAVANSGQPVLIDFWAPWCGPCRMLGPVVDEIATLKSGVAKVCKVNVDEEADLAAKFRVTSIPLLVFIKNGQVVAQKVGVQSKSGIIEQLESMA